MKIGVVDCSFPAKKPLGFRNKEINWLLKNNKNVVAYTPFPMKPGNKAWFKHGYGVEETEFKERLKNYLKYYPENKGRVIYLSKTVKEPFLAFSYFLSDTYTYLAFFEKNKLPFCFMLYPGGGFGINNPSSDLMLKQVFNSKFFRRVIVTSDVTENYLYKKNICDKEKISRLWGGLPQFKSKDFKNKYLFPLNKDKIDILFVAFKYSENGEDKGYDIFIEAAKIALMKNSNLSFHVVGDFTEDDYDVTDIKNEIVFHGVLSELNLKKLYEKIDIQISLSRSGILYDGNFDGFPLGLDAFFAGVLLITSDLHNQNNGRFNNQEICIVKPNPEQVAKKVIDFAKHPKIMYEIARNGQRKANYILNPRKRVKKLMSILKKETRRIQRKALRATLIKRLETIGRSFSRSKQQFMRRKR